MSTASAPSSANDLEHDLEPVARTLAPRPSRAPQSGRWWFVFDRWLAVTEVATQDEFVMA